MMQSGRQRRFSSCTFDHKTGDLTRNGVRLRLEHQPKTVLRLLIEANGDMIARSELIAALWPGESEGDFDRRLDKAIAKLRICLHDNPQKPRYIETLRGLGYRLLVKVFDEPTGSGKEYAAAQIAGLALAEESCSAAQEAIRTELLFKAVITVEASINFGFNALGDRRLAPIVSGWFEGPRIKGEILPGSLDWQLIRPDNVTEIEAHYTLKTHDGVLIRAVNRGYRHRSPDGMQRLAAGEEINSTAYYIRATPVFDAPSGQYDWLNRSLFICTGQRYLNSVVINIFEIL